MPYRLAIAHQHRLLCTIKKKGWIEGLEPSASRATIWRASQLRHTHHKKIGSACSPIRAGLAGFEPANAAVKVLCLTAWR